MTEIVENNEDQPTSKEIKGYSPVSDEAKQAVNYNKELEEIILRTIEEIQNNTALNADPRSLAIAKTDIQTAFMWLNRAIFKPERIVHLKYHIS